MSEVSLKALNPEHSAIQPTGGEGIQPEGGDGGGGGVVRSERRINK